VNNGDSYICDSEEFGFPCTYPNCACEDGAGFDEIEVIVDLEDTDDDEGAYLEEFNQTDN